MSSWGSKLRLRDRAALLFLAQIVSINAYSEFAIFPRCIVAFGGFPTRSINKQPALMLRNSVPKSVVIGIGDVHLNTALLASNKFNIGGLDVIRIEVGGREAFHPALPGDNGREPFLGYGFGTYIPHQFQTRNLDSLVNDIRPEIGGFNLAAIHKHYPNPGDYRLRPYRTGGKTKIDEGGVVAFNECPIEAIRSLSGFYLLLHLGQSSVQRVLAISQSLPGQPITPTNLSPLEYRENRINDESDESKNLNSRLEFFASLFAFFGGTGCSIWGYRRLRMEYGSDDGRIELIAFVGGYMTAIFGGSSSD